MKKHLLFVALAGVALAGCVKNEIETPQDKDVKIGFATPVLYQNVGTKATVYGEIGSHKYDGTETIYTYPRDEKFMIFAVEHVGNLTSWDNGNPTGFNNTAISYDSDLDAWAPMSNEGYYYWPDGKMLSFAAMSPAELDVPGATVNYDSQGLTITNFNIADDPAKQYDLLYSDRAANMTSANMVNGADYYSGIPITFNHALASIHFSLKKDVDETVTLLKIELKNAKNKGTFMENITNEIAFESNPEWQISSEATDIDNYTSFTGEVLFPKNPQYVSSIAAADGPDTDESYPLLLMPQTLTDDVIVTVTYKVGTGEPKNRDVILKNYTPEWAIGTKYTYRLVYSESAHAQDIIYFSPGTSNWAEGGIIEVLL